MSATAGLDDDEEGYSVVDVDGGEQECVIWGESRLRVGCSVDWRTAMISVPYLAAHQLLLPF